MCMCVGSEVGWGRDGGAFSVWMGYVYELCTDFC